MEHISPTHDNFDFVRTKKPLKRIIRAKQKTKRRTSIPETQVESISTQDIHVDDLPPVLARYTIYIHHSTSRTRLAVIAEGMGATVVSEMTSATTHLVIDPKNDAKAMKVVKQALANGVICSSPQWLIECYEKKVYLSAVHFPYAMEKDAHVLSEPALVSDPFANDYVDFDAEESRRANGGQTNLDEYITRGQRGSSLAGEETAATAAAANRQRESSALLDNYQQQVDNDHGYTPFTASQHYFTQDGALEEEEEMRREFFYNSNESSVETTATTSAALSKTTVQETEEDMLKRKREAEEKSLQAQQAIQQRLSAIEKEPPRSKKTLQSGFGERLRIWYGEHAGRSEEARKRKALGAAPTTASHASSSASTPTTRRQTTITSTSNARRQKPVQKKPKI